MGVTTSFDENRENVLMSLDKLISEIQEGLLDEHTWGYRDMKTEYHEKVERAWIELKKIRRDL